MRVPQGNVVFRMKINSPVSRTEKCRRQKNIITVLLALLLIGALHHINQKSEEVETVTAEQAYINQLSDTDTLYSSGANGWGSHLLDPQ